MEVDVCHDPYVRLQVFTCSEPPMGTLVLHVCLEMLHV